MQEISCVNDYYKFSCDASEYYIFQYLGGIEELFNIYEINKKMINKNIPIMEIVNSIYDIYFIYENKIYVVVKSFAHEINLENSEIYYFDYLFKWLKNIEYNFRNETIFGHYQNNWKNLWIKKVDQYETYINSLVKKDFNSFEFSSYYIGIAENAILYLSSISNVLDNMNSSVTFVHKKIEFNDFFVSFYNPLNIVVDYRIRDIAHYIHYILRFEEKSFIRLIDLFGIDILSVNEIRTMFARVLFPSFFFDSSLNYRYNVESDELLINHINNYENNLRYLVVRLNDKLKFSNTDWLVKNNYL